MGRWAPVFLGFFLNCIGINIFRENSPGCEPLVSSVIFLTALYIVLWHLRLYPGSFRKLNVHCLYVIEFLVATFLIEHIMTSFWYPLEQSIAAFLPKIAEFEAAILKEGGWDCGGIFTFFNWDGTIVVASYLTSFFFLFAALHATRALDFRLVLDSGVMEFMKDATKRINKVKRRAVKMLFPKKKCSGYRNFNLQNSTGYQCSNNGISLDDSDDDFVPSASDEEDFNFNKKF